MQIALGVILVSGVCSGFLAGHPLPLPMTYQHDISEDVSHSINEIYNSYLAVSDNREEPISKLDMMSQARREYFNKLNKGNRQYNKIGKPPKVEQAYLFVKTMRQRDKRYISYHTLCHFKICNMGRK